MLRPGDTFLLPSRVGGTKHLWIVLTPPDETGKAVCVNITSRTQSFCETTVILNLGDHAFISRESVVRYVDARFLNIREVEASFGSPSGILVAEAEDAESIEA